MIRVSCSAPSTRALLEPSAASASDSVSRVNPETSANMTAAWSACASGVVSGDGKPARATSSDGAYDAISTSCGEAADGPAICFLRSARRERNFRGIS